MANEEKKSYEEVFGVNLDISTVLSGEIVKRFMAQITPEQMQNILNDISKDAFIKKYDGTLEIRMNDSKANSYGFYSNTKTLGEIVKASFDRKLKEELMEECLKVIDTKEYKDKIHAWAEEMVDYCTEGYKNDIKKGLYYKLVGSVVDSSNLAMQHFNAADLKSIIQEEIRGVLMQTGR